MYCYFFQSIDPEEKNYDQQTKIFGVFLGSACGKLIFRRFKIFRTQNDTDKAKFRCTVDKKMLLTI